MSNIKKQLRQLDVGKLKMKTGRTVEQEIRYHASILADCIMEEMQDSIYDYSNKVYKRTYDLWNSLYIDDKMRVDVSSKGTSLSISLQFSDEVMHENFFGESVGVAGILNEGYQTRGSFADVPMLGWREATNFIDNGILKYKQRVSKPFTVKFTINGEERIF
ncbi:MAG: hypothetical protein IKW30_04515 [Lachnospiraceae bacterium]|nr:hypothetical protein [Lachnospiraceae bacterium]